MQPLPRVTKKRQNVLTLSNFSGGLNNRNSNVEIADNESPDLLNVDFSVTGAVSKRHGCAAVGDDKGNSKVLGLTSVCYGNGSAQTLMASQGFTTAGAGYRTTGNWTEATLNASGTNNGTKLANADAEFETFYDGTQQCTFILDGTNYQSYRPTDNKIYGNGAGGLTAPATIGSILRLYKNRMYAVGSTSLPERVYFSNLGNGGIFTVGDFFDVPSTTTNSKGTSGDPITALAVHQDRLIVFKNRSIYAWDTNQLVRITDAHGCVGKRAFCQVDNMLYFADIDGIYALSGNFIEKVSKKIQGTWDVIPAARKLEIAMQYFNGKVYVATAAAAASTNNIVLVNYPLLPVDSEGQHPWTYWSSSDNTNSPLAFSTLVKYTATTTTAPILIGGAANAQTICIQLETGNADVTQTTLASDLAINSYWKSKVFTLSSRHRKQFVTYAAQSVSSLINSLVSFDFDARISANSYQMNLTNSSVYGTGVYSTATYGGLDTIIGKGNVSNRGKFVQFSFSNYQASQPWTVYKLQEVYSPIPLR